MPEREIQIRYQLRWMIIVAVAITAASAAFLSTLRRALDQDLGSSYQQAYATLHNLQKVLLPIISLSVLIYLIVGSGIVAIVTIFISHSIAGPIFKMEQFAASLQRGELDFSMRLRSGDQISLLAESLRELQGVFAGRLRSFGRALDRADRLWTELDAVDPQADPARARELLARIDEELLTADAELVHGAAGTPAR
jgi:methyl-accepting chemotaxis protein